MSEKRRNELLILAGIGVVALYWLTQQGREDPDAKMREDVHAAAEKLDIRIQEIFARFNLISSFDVPKLEDEAKRGVMKNVELDNLNDEVKNLESELKHLFGQLGQEVPPRGQQFISSIREHILVLKEKKTTILQVRAGLSAVHTKITSDAIREQNAVFMGQPPDRQKRTRGAPGLQFEPATGEKRAQPEPAQDFAEGSTGHVGEGTAKLLKGPKGTPIQAETGNVAEPGFNTTGSLAHSNSSATVVASVQAATGKLAKKESLKPANSSGVADKVETVVQDLPMAEGDAPRVRPEPVAKKTPLEPVPEDSTVPTGFEPAKPKPTPTQQIEAAHAEERQTAENSILKLTKIAADAAYRGNAVEARIQMAKRVYKAFEEIKREASTYSDKASPADQKRILQRVQGLIDDFVQPPWVESLYKYDKALFEKAMGKARVIGNKPLNEKQIQTMFNEAPKWFSDEGTHQLSVYWVWNGYYNLLKTQQAYRPWMKGEKRTDRPERPEGDLDPTPKGKRPKPAN